MGNKNNGGAYHEKQWMAQCGKHALNNLFQERWLTTEMLASIARDLTVQDLTYAVDAPKYKSWLGNYDVR